MQAVLKRSRREWDLSRSRMTYYRCHTLYILFFSFIGGALISTTNSVSYLDGFFLAVSAITSTGLTTISPIDLNSETFSILFLLIFLGGSLVLPLGPMYYRRRKYAKLRAAVSESSLEQNHPIVEEFDLQDQALGVMIRTILIYITLWIFLGAAVLWAALHLQPHEPELEQRGYSRASSAIFLSASAFHNAGFSLSSDSVGYLTENPTAYLVLSLLIVAGNTMAPVFYRSIIYMEWRIRVHLKWNAAVLRFIMDNPRRISVNTLPTREVIFLLITTTMLNIVQYIFYLCSVLGRQKIADLHSSNTVLAGVGFFQTISTRNAGLQMMDLRTMNQGMLLVYGIAMYLSGAPFLTALYSSEDSQESRAKRSPFSSLHQNRAKFMDTFILKHSFFIGLGVFICAFSEDEFMRRFPETINLWYIIFEVVSAYGNVGLSLGEPGASFSLVGSFGIVGKLTICAIMLLGKHRTLPKEKDAVIDFKFKRFKKAVQELHNKNKTVVRKKVPDVARPPSRMPFNTFKVVPLARDAPIDTTRSGTEMNDMKRSDRRISFSDEVTEDSGLGLVQRG
eukprot:GSChrysophyteH1.ASY1.ANO1.2858.1 assembled CDS